MGVDRGRAGGDRCAHEACDIFSLTIHASKPQAVAYLGIENADLTYDWLAPPGDFSVDVNAPGVLFSAAVFQSNESQ